MNRKTLLIVASVLGLAVVGMAVASYWQLQNLAREQEDSALSPAFVIPAFQFRNQEGLPFGTEQLSNRIWVANFVFTRCPGPCLQMTKNMAQVQKKLGVQSEVMLVSFTVDPDFDGPDVLKAYGQLHGADWQHWTFVTGDRSALHNLIEKGFKLTVAEATPEEVPETGPFIHSTLFVVVGKDGKTAAYLDGSSPDFLEKMERALKKVSGKKS
jgi:cytochrome oxidase Cu insertion factor (SCO1/SenC/PrrC family)